MNKKTFRILEIVWLLIAIGGLLMIGYTLIKGNMDQVLYFCMFTAVAALMYYLRRRTRMRMEQEEETKS